MFEYIKRWVSDLYGGRGHAVHVIAGNNHTVAILSMRVIIVQDSPNTWFAQSLDINYAAGGLSIEEVKRNFEQGLSGTLKAHLEKFGNIDRIMQSPPFEDWGHLLENAGQFEFSMGESHRLDQDILTHHLPYQGIAYIEPSRKAA